MAERHVLVTVRIGPTGSFCREPDYGDACPYLDTDVGLRPQMRCLLHRDPKGEPVDLDDHDTLGSDGDLDFFQPRRATACLALDGGGVGEPNGVGDGPALPHRRRRRGTTTGLPWPGVRAPP